MFENFIFYPFSALAVLGALGVITLRKPTYALLSLMGTMFSLAVLFFLLGAPFVAMVHLVVYAGAVLVLFLFVIMLLGLSAKESRATEGFKKAFCSNICRGSFIYSAYPPSILVSIMLSQRFCCPFLQ